MVVLEFAKRESVSQVEEGVTLAPRFDAAGLLPCVVTDAATGDVLMLGYMDREALSRSIATGAAHYWSRTRRAVWRKGETSGLEHRIVEMRIDDDQDALWLRVAVAGVGASCHVGYRSCFYRQVNMGEGTDPQQSLVFIEHEKVFDPATLYRDMPNPTIL